MKNLKQIIYGSMMFLGMSGFIGGTSYGVGSILLGDQMVNSAWEKFPEHKGLFHSDVRYELSDKERELIEARWNYGTYGLLSAVASGVLFFYSSSKLSELEKDEDKTP